MGRPKGGKNRSWSKEEKLRIVKRNLVDLVGQDALAKEEGISKGMLWRWIDAYLEYGEAGLDPRTRRGNPFAALHTSKKS